MKSSFVLSIMDSTCAVLGKLWLTIFVVVIMASQVPVFAQDHGSCERGSAEQYLDVNNVRARIVNTGGLFYRGEPHVYEVPKGSGSNAIFSAGLWLVGLFDGELRVSATRYSGREMWPGPLDDDGLPPADCEVYDRIYKVSRFETDTGDYRDWPTGLGAPTMDASGHLVDLSNLPFSERQNRVIDLKNGEQPAIYGDQSVWWIMNDRGNEHPTSTPPIGVEVHGLAYAALHLDGFAGNTTLYKFTIINRNSLPWTDAYVGFFFDTDLGDFDDDYIGSDTLLGMGFTYNQDNEDGGAEGYGAPPPALGVLLAEGPIADDDLIDNDRDGDTDEPGERLRMSTFGSYGDGGGFRGVPNTGTHYYYYLQGRWKNGAPFEWGRGPFDSQIRCFSSCGRTHFFYPGNPATLSFWSEVNSDGQGTANDPGDRRWYVSSGPFSLEPGESTDFTVAIVWSLGKDHLDSVTQLKSDAAQVLDAFAAGAWNDRVFSTPPGVMNTSNFAAALDENYPNPFSDQTIIRYRLPHAAHVRLSIFDLLGRAVATLLDKQVSEGTHTAVFDGSKYPSGLYFYRIELGHTSEFRKMVLQK